ncbi:MAG: ABC transporter ATP-binding protein [Erysipelotrichaceae bacterium]
MRGGKGPRGFQYESEEEKKNRPKVTLGLLKRIFSTLVPYWPKLALSLVTILVIAILDVLPSILTGKIIDDGFLKGDMNLITTFVSLAIGVMLCSSLLSIFENYLNTWVSQHIAKDMKNAMYAHLQKMSQHFFTTNKQGDIITRVTSDINGVQSVITGTLTSTISNVAILLTSMIAMMQKNWVLALVGLAILPLFILPTKQVGKKRWKITTDLQAKHDTSNQILNETLSVSGQQLVKLFTAEELEYEKYASSNEEILKLTIKENMVGRWFRMAIGTFTNIGPMLIYLIAGVLMIEYNQTSLSVGDVTVLVTLLTRMYRPVVALLNVPVDFSRALALFTRIFEYMDMPIEISSREDALTITTMEGNVSFEDVCFSYNKDKQVLTDVSFDLPANKMTALVGVSGGGKSTITNLLLRMYDVSHGSVKIDGHDIRDLDLKDLRNHVGMVSQEAYLFNDTIRANLQYAKADASEAELVAVCKEANIYDLISSLPQGFDTVVGNRGVKLSGGEKQRISIARAILKNPSILIFDEATSALDSISEEAIQEAMEPILKQRTSLVIAHRLSTIMAADQILVLDGGQVVERGTHHDLLRLNGTYTKLYETQFKKALEAERAKKEH